MDKGEWYFEVGYVELLYAAMVVGIAIALYYFRRLKQVSELAATLEEHSLLLGLLVLAVVLFMLNRLLGDLW